MIRPLASSLAALAAILVLSGCIASAPDPTPAGTASPSPSVSATATASSPSPVPSELPTPRPSAAGEAADACTLVAGAGDHRTEAAALAAQAAAEDPDWTDLATALQTLSGRSFPAADSDPADVNAYLEAYTAVIPLCATAGVPLPEG